MVRHQHHYRTKTRDWSCMVIIEDDIVDNQIVRGSMIKKQKIDRSVKHIVM